MKMDKTEAYNNFMDMIFNSWTWQRLTDDERGRFAQSAQEAKLIGTYKQRYEQLHAIYRAFLLALGYSWAGWREGESA